MFLFVFLKDSLAMQPRLDLILGSACLGLPSAGTTGVSHCTWLRLFSWICLQGKLTRLLLSAMVTVSKTQTKEPEQQGLKAKPLWRQHSLSPGADALMCVLHPTCTVRPTKIYCGLQGTDAWGFWISSLAFTPQTHFPHPVNLTVEIAPSAIILNY